MRKIRPFWDGPANTLGWFNFLNSKQTFYHTLRKGRRIWSTESGYSENRSLWASSLTWFRNIAWSSKVSTLTSLASTSWMRIIKKIARESFYFVSFSYHHPVSVYVIFILDKTYYYDKKSFLSFTDTVPHIVITFAVIFSFGVTVTYLWPLSLHICHGGRTHVFF